MASAFITNTLQVNFDSVLGISDNDEMVNMFKALESTGVRDFLGCPSVLYEQELEQFFDTALVRDGDITCVVSGKYVAIPEDRFAGIFNLPTEGLTDLSEVPNNLVLQARTLFSKSSVPVQFSCKKILMKYEIVERYFGQVHYCESWFFRCRHPRKVSDDDGYSFWYQGQLE
ncbi:hypothetical protein F511_45606 [Dorcoceras hygrometricum]|uniref:Uncharacterized protein n=1 Tax=Dorcoceras hygrometricum TaxID=472368 RepID=A0A2Z7A323_9LAMI|nr:hypothetical protein F511_45606 [Dorcoceras hygrometricum]